MTRLILWDIDGTILDFLLAEKAAIKACFEKLHLGNCTDQMISRYSQINVGYWKKLEKGEMSKSEILVGRFRDFFKEYGIDETKAEAFNSEYQIRLGDTTVFTPTARETLFKLKGKIIQAAVTNGTKIAQDRKIKNSGLDRLFDYIFISEDIGFEKPSPLFFQKVFETVGNAADDKSQVLIVGDSLTSDITGGKNAGIKTCWYNPQNLPLPEESPVPDFTISQVSQVLDLLK